MIAASILHSRAKRKVIRAKPAAPRRRSGRPRAGLRAARPRPGKPGKGPPRRGIARSLLASGRLGVDSLARRLAALGSSIRLRMMAALAEGELGHADLKATLGLHPGPLYHHVTCLQLAGLLHKTGRDRYDLTFAGRRLIRAMPAIQKLLREVDRGRR